jgi:hypothetical protein
MCNIALSSTIQKTCRWEKVKLGTKSTKWLLKKCDEKKECEQLRKRKFFFLIIGKKKAWKNTWKTMQMMLHMRYDSTIEMRYDN